MCRKELVTTPKASAPLRCRYMTNNSPFLKIAPLKLEEASLDPYIVVYHDVLYDAEIEKIKEFSMPRVSKSMTNFKSHHKFHLRSHIIV